MVELRRDAWEVADAVAVRVRVRTRVCLVDDGVVPPHQTAAPSRSRWRNAWTSAPAINNASPTAIATSARLKAMPFATRGFGTPSLQAIPPTTVASAPPAAIPAPTVTDSEPARGASA